MNYATRVGHRVAARHLGGLLALLLVLALATPAAQAVQVVPTLRIGYLGVQDSEVANGAQLAIDQINEAGGVIAANGMTFQLSLVTLAEPLRDDTLPQALDALVAQNVGVLLGPDTSAPLSPTNIDLLVGSGRAVLTTATADALTATDARDVIFRLVAPERVYSYALAVYLLDDLDLDTVAVVQTDVDSTEALLDFGNILTERSVEPVGTVQLADATLLMEETAPLLDINPDAVVMWGPPADAVTLLTLLRDAGWTGQFAYRHAEEASRLGVLPDALGAGTLGVSSWSYAHPGRPAGIFLTDYLTTFGHIPGPLAIAGYDAVWYLRTIVRESGTGQAEILAGLRRGPTLGLVAGTLRPADFADGDLIRTAVVYRLRPGGGTEVLAVFDELARIPIE